MIRHRKDGTVTAYTVAFIITLDDPEALRQTVGCFDQRTRRHLLLRGPRLVPVTITRGFDGIVMWEGHYDLSRGGGLICSPAWAAATNSVEALRQYDERMRLHVLTWARLLPHLGIEAYAKIASVLGWARVPAVEWRALARRVHAIEAREGSAHPVSHWRFVVEEWFAEEADREEARTWGRIASDPDWELSLLRHIVEGCHRNDDGSLTLGSEDVANLERALALAAGD